MSLITLTKLLNSMIQYVTNGLWSEQLLKMSWNKLKYCKILLLFKLMMTKFTFLVVKITTSNFFIYNFRYSVEKGFILQITEIKERRKGAAKVNG